MKSDDIDLRSAVLKGFFWLGSGQFIGQAISWVATIMVIRLLAPADYGLMAMAASFVWLLSLMSELGIGASLIQAKDITREEIQKVYGLVLICSVGFVAMGYVAAPFVAAFYGEPRVTDLIRVTSLGFVVAATFVVPQSLVVRRLDFKRKTTIDVAAQVATALLTAGMALVGAGVWSLAVGPLAGYGVRAVAYNVSRRDRVTPRFELGTIRRFFAYGLTMTGDRLAYYCYTVSDTVIIGRVLGETLLGTYSVAHTLASLPSEKLLPIVTQVSFASYSRIQDDRERIARNVRRSIQVISFVAFPIFFLMASVAPEAIALILGDRWRSIVVPFQVLCLIMPLTAIAPVLPPAVFATGRPMVNLVNMVFSFAAMAIAFLIAVRYGVVAVCLAWVVVYPLVFLVTTKRCVNAIGLRLTDVLKEIWFPLLASGVILAAVMAIKAAWTAPAHLASLVALLGSAVATYAALVMMFRKSDCVRLKHVLFG